jgi:tetratricopeptide (TPR) repeat protein
MTEAERLLEEGLQLAHAGDDAAAERAYKAAAQLSPDWSVPFYNLGLMYKYQLRWRDSFEFNKRASALDPDDEAGWWNLGIAATALADWTEARKAWTKCGLNPPDGEGPPDFGWGSNPVRLDPNGDAEVVWAKRIDPARASIVSIPLPWSRHNFGDLVLTDGAAEGHRVANGHEYPVFNVLATLAPSRHKKFVIELATSHRETIEALSAIATERGGAAEDWGASTNILCAKCSHGTPHEHTSTNRSPAHPHCGLAALDDERAEAIIKTWMKQQPRADVVRWYDANAATA